MKTSANAVRSAWVASSIATALILGVAGESRSQTSPPDSKTYRPAGRVRSNEVEKTIVRRVVPASPPLGQVGEVHAKLGQTCTTCHVGEVNRVMMHHGGLGYTALPDVVVVATDDALRAQLNIEGKTGLVVTSVRAGTVPATLGLRVNDILLKYGSVELKEPADLGRSSLTETKEGAKLKLLREGKERTIEVTAEALEQLNPKIALWTGVERLDLAWSAPQFWIGVAVTDIDATLRSQLGLKGKSGLLASDVVVDSPAGKAGLKINDIVLDVSGKAVSNSPQLIARIQEAKGEAVTLNLLRGGKPLKIQVTPAKRAEPLAATDQFDQKATTLFRALTVQPGVVYDATPSRDTALRLGLNRIYGLQVSPVERLADPLVDANLDARLKELSAQMEAIRKSLDELKKTDRAPKVKDKAKE